MSDELGLFAHARPAILARTPGEAAAAVERLVESEGAGEVVVGLPLTLAGNDSEQTRAARQFAAELRRRLQVPVTEWDERLSSSEAARGRPGSSRRRDGSLDSAAAAIVLQAVLDARRGRQP